jgi:hypothetical protein
MLKSRIYLFGGGGGGEKLTNGSKDNASEPTGRNQQVESNGNEGDGEKKRQKKQGVTQVQNVTRVETIEALTKEKRLNSDAEDLFPLSESLRLGDLEEDDSDFEPSDEEPDDDFEYDSDEASEAKSAVDGSGLSRINKGMEQMELEEKEGIGLDEEVCPVDLISRTYYDSDCESNDSSDSGYSSESCHSYDSGDTRESKYPQLLAQSLSYSEDSDDETPCG